VDRIDVALLGLGTVGTGVYKMLQSNQDVIARRTGLLFEVKHILVRDPNKKRKVDGVQHLLTTRFEEIMATGVDVVMEAMGGVEPARTYIERAIRTRCHVVTANKELIAKHGAELEKLAREHGVQLLYEASVGGGIPVLGTLQHFLKANRIMRVSGILNGTTNFILTQMGEHQRPLRKCWRRPSAGLCGSRSHRRCGRIGCRPQTGDSQPSRLRGRGVRRRDRPAGHHRHFPRGVGVGPPVGVQDQTAGQGGAVRGRRARRPAGGAHPGPPVPSLGRHQRRLQCHPCRSGHGSGRDAGRTGGGRATHRQRHGGGPLQPVPPPPSPAASLPTAFGSPRLGGGGSPLRLHRDEGPPRLRHLSPGEGAVETVRDLGRGCRLAAGGPNGARWR